MHLNQTIKLPASKTLSRAELLSMENILRRIRQSGEIHIETTGSGLTLCLRNPHNKVEGDALTDEQLATRGITPTLTFGGIEKIMISHTHVVLIPMKRNGHASRKRTLRQRRGWICTKRTHFSDFTLTDSA